MSVKDLISLANEFIEASPATIRAPFSAEISSKSPVSITHKKEEVFQSTMDFNQVIHTIRNYAKLNLLKDGDRLGEIKHSQLDGGSHFGITVSTSPQAKHIYSKMLSVFLQLYPTTHHQLGHNYATLNYPEEMGRVTFRHFGQDITFKIADSE